MEHFQARFICEMGMETVPTLGGYLEEKNTSFLQIFLLSAGNVVDVPFLSIVGVDEVTQSEKRARGRALRNPSISG